MSDNAIVKQLSSSYKEALLAAKLAREIQVIMKGKAKRKAHDAMSDDEALKLLAEEIYSELKPEYKEHIRFEYLQDLVVANKKRFLKKKKNRRNLFGDKK